MTPPPGVPARAGLGRIVAGAALFCLFAPAALLALPLAAMLLVARPRSRADVLLAVLATAFCAWWLVQPGDLAEQVLRGAAVLGTVAFIALGVWTRWSVTHRSLVALVVAAAGMGLLLQWSGHTWWELAWTVGHQSGFYARQSYGLMWSAMPHGTDGLPTPSAARWLKDLGTWMDRSVELVSAYYPATVALQMLCGFALASALDRFLATPAPGLPLGRLREFRFSEHLGWGVAIPLIIFLVPTFSDARVAAGNVLAVTVALYALRGAAVVSFILAAAGGASLLTNAAMAFAIVFMLPVVLAAAVLLGVLDAGLDLRRRRASPPAGA